MIAVIRGARLIYNGGGEKEGFVAHTVTVLLLAFAERKKAGMKDSLYEHCCKRDISRKRKQNRETTAECITVREC